MSPAAWVVAYGSALRRRRLSMDMGWSPAAATAVHTALFKNGESTAVASLRANLTFHTLRALLCCPYDNLALALPLCCLTAARGPRRLANAIRGADAVASGLPAALPVSLAQLCALLAPLSLRPSGGLPRAAAARFLGDSAAWGAAGGEIPRALPPATADPSGSPPGSPTPQRTVAAEAGSAARMGSGTARALLAPVCVIDMSSHYRRGTPANTRVAALLNSVAQLRRQSALSRTHKVTEGKPAHAEGKVALHASAAAALRPNRPLGGRGRGRGAARPSPTNLKRTAPCAVGGGAGAVGAWHANSDDVGESTERLPAHVRRTGGRGGTPDRPRKTVRVRRGTGAETAAEPVPPQWQPLLRLDLAAAPSTLATAARFATKGQGAAADNTAGQCACGDSLGAAVLITARLNDIRGRDATAHSSSGLPDDVAPHWTRCVWWKHTFAGAACVSARRVIQRWCGVLPTSPPPAGRHRVPCTPSFKRCSYHHWKPARLLVIVRGALLYSAASQPRHERRARRATRAHGLTLLLARLQVGTLVPEP